MKKPILATPRQVFARNLRTARRLQDMSQEKLALQAGMSRAYVSGVELGQRNISIDNMGLLAEAIGRPLKELVDPDMFSAVERREPSKR